MYIRDVLRFQVAYQRILQLTYVDDLLGALKTVFVKLFQPFIAAFVASLHAVNNTAVALSNSASEPTRWNFVKALEGWDATFDKLLKGLENKAAEVRFCLNVSTRALTQSHARHFRTVNIVCAPQLDSLRLLPALVPVILIHVGIIYNFPTPPLRADISFGRVTSWNSGRAADRAQCPSAEK